MVDIQSIAQTASTATNSAAAPLTALQVAIADITQAIETLSRSIQINATVASAPVATAQGTELSLTTTLGTLTVMLPSLGVAEQQKLTQTLLNLVQSQKQITVTILPGTPPTQAVLLVPLQQTSLQQQPQQTSPNLSTMPQTVAAGNDFPAVVLPSSSPPYGLQAPTGVTLSTLSQNLPSSVPSQNLSLPQEEPLVAQGTNPVISSNGDIQTPYPPSSQQLASLPQEKIQTQIGNQIQTQMPQASIPQQAADGRQPLPTNLLSVSTNVVPATLQPLTGETQASRPTPLSLLLQTGNDVMLHIDAIIKPNQALPQLEPNQIIATVTGTATGGQLILKAGDANLFVKANAAAAPGTQLVVTVTADRSSPLVTFPPIDPLTYTSLPQAVVALAQADPQALSQMMANHMPQPNQALPGALLFLMSAFKQGSVRGWLGDDATDVLSQAGHGDIIAKLSQELGGAGQTAQDPVVGQWRTYPIPLYSQQNFQALTLYVHDGPKDRRGERDSGGSSNKIRFLIDMRLSKLGEMQLDGFIQPKKLDIVLRSASRLPEGLHQHLRSAYIRAVGAVGYAGSLNFQVGRAQWMTMKKSGTQTVV